MILFLGILFAGMLFSNFAVAQEIEIKSVSGAIAETLPSEQDDVEQSVNLDEVTEDSYARSYAEGDDSSAVEDLVLAVTADNKVLSAGIFAIQKNGQYYLPVAALSDLVDFYYDIDSAKNTVNGWALFEKDSYLIDLPNKTLRFRGENFDLPSSAVIGPEVVDGDVYVLSDVLSQIWPIDFDVNLSRLILDVVPDKPLPFQTAKSRERARDRAEEQRANQENEKDFTFIPYPYQAYTNPTIDVTTSAGFDPNRDSFIAGLNVNGVNDLAYASADYSASFFQEGGEFRQPENIRFRLRRQNIYDGALPFGLEDTQLGDVRLNNRELISNNIGGRGFTFSTEDNDKSGEFDLITIDGTGTPGWEVEVYLNNELLEFGVIDERGEYRFQDISVGFGNNRFRIVLYGPQGQIKERVENYVYQSSLVKKGENVFSGGIIDANNDLFPIDERVDGLREGLAANIYAARGIKDRLTTFFTANTLRDRDGADDVSRQYVSVGAIGSLGTTLAQVEGYKQLGGGEAVDVRTVSGFKGFRINAQVSAFNDFESPDAGNGPNARELETTINIRKIFQTAIGALGLEVGQNYRRGQEGITSTDYTTRQSLGIGSLRMSNTTRSVLSDGDHLQSTGRFVASRRHNRWNFRNSFDYDISPDFDVTAVQSELRYRQSRDYSAAITADYSFVNDQTGLGFQISRDFKRFLASAQTNWRSTTGWGFTLQASTSFGPYGDNNTYTNRSTPLSNVGPVNSFVYNDENYNGVFDADDEPLEDVRVTINRRITRDRTDEGGNLLQFVGANATQAKIKVARESVEDPYIISSVPGYRIYPRAGVVHQLDFPLIETGAIDGTLRWSNGGEPISGVELQLLDEDGETIKDSRTASDGYFTFEQIPPGSYTIRPAPENGLDIPFKYVNLTPDNLFQFGIDMSATANDGVEEIDLDTSVAEDGTLNVKDIISLAKGYKEKTSGKIYKASMSSGRANQGVRNNTAQPGKPNINRIRIGEHSDKVRVVLDLSAPVDYAVNHDPQSNSVFVDIPYASLSAKSRWDTQKRAILSSYNAEVTDQGVRLVLGVADNVAVGASGVLKADAGRSDRLYIDIEKK